MDAFNLQDKAEKNGVVQVLDFVVSSHIVRGHLVRIDKEPILYFH